MPKAGGGAAATRDENESDHQGRSGIREGNIREDGAQWKFWREDQTETAGGDFPTSSASMDVFKESCNSRGLIVEIVVLLLLCPVGTIIHPAIHPPVKPSILLFIHPAIHPSTPVTSVKPWEESGRPRQNRRRFTQEVESETNL